MNRTGRAGSESARAGSAARGQGRRVTKNPMRVAKPTSSTLGRRLRRRSLRSPTASSGGKRCGWEPPSEPSRRARGPAFASARTARAVAVFELGSAAPAPSRRSRLSHELRRWRVGFDSLCEVDARLPCASGRDRVGGLREPRPRLRLARDDESRARSIRSRPIRASPRASEVAAAARNDDRREDGSWERRATSMCDGATSTPDGVGADRVRRRRTLVRDRRRRQSSASASEAGGSRGRDRLGRPTSRKIEARHVNVDGSTSAAVGPVTAWRCAWTALVGLTLRARSTFAGLWTRVGRSGGITAGITADPLHLASGTTAAELAPSQSHIQSQFQTQSSPVPCSRQPWWRNGSPWSCRTT